MSRPMVVDEDGVRVPFLRGILTHSLQERGFAFDDAYRVASAVREELESVGEIATTELRALVERHLAALGKDAVARYGRPAPVAPTILIRYPSDTAPFSRGRLRLCLESCALMPEQAAAVAAAVYARLTREGSREIPVRRLQELTVETLRSEIGEDAARGYTVWEAFRRSGRSLLVLVGGATGCGKTTLATRLAHMLEFMRMQSTDMLRQVMRVMVPKRLLPVLHVDSFRAWEVLPGADAQAADIDARIAQGYLQQAELLALACEAAIQRAVEERQSLILEGVHVTPGLAARIHTDAVVVPVILAVLKPDLLRQRLLGRGEESPARGAEKYLDNADAIWRLQTFLLSEADRAGIPIVVNDDRDRTVQQIAARIIDVLARTLPEEAEGP